ncbi:MAG: N4-bis(aminopropyl)spermidine synthase, partial [Mycobacteriales bacterium]
PAAEVLVVDIDQRVLGYIEQVAAERGLAITTAFADLRLGLPASFAGQADLVFTDPPYTPDGVGLFLTRGLQGLRRSGHERIALAYGFANRQLARGFRTQAVLHELRLVLEALLPGFNRFGGAEAIGSASDLYVCRPTRFSWPVIERATTGDPRIYTRGAAATESAPATLPASIVDEVRVALGAEQAAYVGDGWPAGGNRRQVGLAEYLAASPHRRRPVAVNLYPHFGAVLPQAMLAAAVAERAVLVAPAKDVEAIVDSPVWTLLAGTDIEARPGTESGLLVLRRAGQPSTPAGRVYEFLVRHPEAKVGNAWRDALVTAATRGTEDAEDASAGAPLTKNQARALIQAAGVPERALHLRLGELPMDTLATLAAAVARAVRPVAQ